MPLPETIRVKISSEAAGYLSMTPVVAQQMPVPAFLEQILRVAGKDAARIHDILRQGTVVSGASRFRWAPFEASLEELAEALRAFPDPLPGRPFDAAKCVRATLAGGRAAIELTRENASEKRWLRKRSFWQALMETAAQAAPVYQQYSYAEHADLYRAELPLDAARTLREQAGLLRYTSLEMQVREYSYDKLELWVER
ncbi:MAG: hypothetical protein HY238_22650 [Acidobacteria bacterium]|nr:hypothetical protein [Acidobacteriota bacterium]